MKMPHGVGLLIVAATLSMSAQKKPVPVTAEKTQPCLDNPSQQCSQTKYLAELHQIASARTAAVVIKADRSISCGDGSEGSCLGEDSNTALAMAGAVTKSDVWRYLTKVDPAKADILLKFSVHNAERVYCVVYDADSNKVLWVEDRVLVAADNDVARILAHFLNVWQSGQR